MRSSTVTCAMRLLFSFVTQRRRKIWFIRSWGQFFKVMATTSRRSHSSKSITGRRRLPTMETVCRLTWVHTHLLRMRRTAWISLRGCSLFRLVRTGRRTRRWFRRRSRRRTSNRTKSSRRPMVIPNSSSNRWIWSYSKTSRSRLTSSNTYPTTRCSSGLTRWTVGIWKS